VRHFDGRKFFNPNGNRARGLRDVLRWKWTTRPEPSPEFVDDVTPSRPPASVGPAELRITLVNHSTVLIQSGGQNILTDPVWSERASPVSWTGPRRRRAPGVRFEDLPRIDTVLISHNHYDHLDLDTVRRLGARFVAPLGVGKLLRSVGVEAVEEVDWGGAAGTIHCVPAVHFSGRGLFDRDRTLWCGYWIETPAGGVYFAGDTAFGDHFAAIRERFGRPRLALLPVGAYEPRWFMSSVHMDPAEAVRAHEILGAGTSVAIHQGTFQLADESLDTPRRVLGEIAAGLPFVVLGNGEALEVA
jgi:L-ascorbate metabolism protein UlaG (beta-lactamase superfamily)